MSPLKATYQDVLYICSEYNVFLYTVCIYINIQRSGSFQRASQATCNRPYSSSNIFPVACPFCNTWSVVCLLTLEEEFLLLMDKIQNPAPFRMAKTLLIMGWLTYQPWPGPGCFRAPRTQDVRHCEGMVCFRDLIWQPSTGSCWSDTSHPPSEVQYYILDPIKAT